MFHLKLPQPSDYSWQASEVIHVLNDKPHLLIKIEILGPYFPHRAVEPFVRIVDEEGRVTDNWFAEISEDNRRLLGYFTVVLPTRGRIEFGYGKTSSGTMDVLYDKNQVQLLERERLPKDVIVARPEDVKEWQDQK
jgi:hypothetical protein